MIKKFKIDINSCNQRVDRFLKRQFSKLSQSFIEKNLRKKNIIVNDQIIKSNYLVKIGDIISIKNYSEDMYPKYEKKKSITKINKSFKNFFDKSILYENENFIVIDKWFGISTQGGTNVTMSIDAIIKSISMDYNLVHRLDKETAGLLIIAKNFKYTKIFGQIFKSQKLKKTYLALCEGKPKLKESFVDLIINAKNKGNFVNTKTYYKVISYNQKVSLIKFEPKTGKKHQLRIVAKNLGCPIVGDLKYNLNKKKPKEKLKLNAFKLKFAIGNDEFNFQSKLPKDFNDYLKYKNIKFNLKTI